jgi:MmyB-like transcription regulator ligand binding domain
MSVAFLRTHAGEYLDDARPSALVRELSLRDPGFRRWWASREIATATTGTKTLRHPVAGEITVGWEMLASMTDPDQQIVVTTAEPGSPSHQALPFLASWATERVDGAEKTWRQIVDPLAGAPTSME